MSANLLQHESYLSLMGHQSKNTLLAVQIKVELQILSYICKVERIVVRPYSSIPDTTYPKAGHSLVLLSDKFYS